MSVISKKAGHKRIITTQGYIKVTAKEMKECPLMEDTLFPDKKVTQPKPAQVQREQQQQKYGRTEGKVFNIYAFKMPRRVN